MNEIDRGLVAVYSRRSAKSASVFGIDPSTSEEFNSARRVYPDILVLVLIYSNAFRT